MFTQRKIHLKTRLCSNRSKQSKHFSEQKALTILFWKGWNISSLSFLVQRNVSTLQKKGCFLTLELFFLEFWVNWKLNANIQHCNTGISWQPSHRGRFIKPFHRPPRSTCSRCSQVMQSLVHVCFYHIIIYTFFSRKRSTWTLDSQYMHH